MVTRAENCRNFFAKEFNGARVEGETKETGIGVGVVLVRFWRAEDTGEEANDAVGHGERRKFSPSENEITDGEDVGSDLGCDALIYAFVMSANEDEVLGLAELLGVGLGEQFAGGVGEDNFCLGIW